MNAQDIINVTGQHILFLGVGTYGWSIDQFKQAAQFARAHGVDCLLVKCADGGSMWYGGMSGWHNIRNAILSESVGAIPYTYTYGNKFGALDTEIDIMIAHMQDCGVVCADMEVEWNGQVEWAQHLTSRIQPLGKHFLVSTWADPSLQNWQNVIRALAPCTTVFMPQQYTNYLGTFWAEFGANGATWLQPTMDLTQGFGPNDPVALAKAAHSQGHTGLSVWYYDTAVANPGLLDAVYAAFPKSSSTGGSTPPMNGTTYGPGKGDFGNWFTVSSDGNWTCKQTGAVLMGGNKALYSQLSMDGNTLPVIGLPKESEQYQADGSSRQRCERAVIIYDPKKNNNQPGMSNSYLGFISYDPPTVTIEKIPDSVVADIKALKAAGDKLVADAGILATP